MPKTLRLLLILALAGLLIFLTLRKMGQVATDQKSSTTPDETFQASSSQDDLPLIFDPAFLRLRPTEIAQIPRTTRVTQAMGAENSALSYNAQPFRINRHLGDDLNGIGGWNSDFGDAVYAIGTGLVTYAGNPSKGWGNSVSLAHRFHPGDLTEISQSFYAHLSATSASFGDLSPLGTSIGKVGTADGQYLAHLHLEIRRGLTCDPGSGYHDQPLNRVAPEIFLKERQPQTQTLLLAPGIHVKGRPTTTEQAVRSGTVTADKESAARESQQ